MRPLENFYYYDPKSGKCVNFPYTGACGNPNFENGYNNIFSSYDDCMEGWQAQGVTSTDDVVDYNVLEKMPGKFRMI